MSYKELVIKKNEILFLAKFHERKLFLIKKSLLIRNMFFLLLIHNYFFKKLCEKEENLQKIKRVLYLK